jgi:hypothetical protein
MKTRLFDAGCFMYCCVCAAGLLGLFARAETSGGVPQSRKLTLGELCERIDRTFKVAETNENARKYPDVRNDIFIGIVQDVNAIGRLGDRAALPFLEEKSFSTNGIRTIRERAAAAYVKIANLDESVEFMKKLYAEDSDKTGHWRYMLNQQLLEKFEQAKQKSVVDVDIANRFYMFLVTQVQTPVYPTQAAQIDAYLIRNLPGYESSKQRAVIGDVYASSNNEWRVKTFNPIKAHFDKIPPSKRIDLRDRFPDLPPLPQDKAATKPLKVALAIGAAFAAICAAVWLAAKRRKTQTREKE